MKQTVKKTAQDDTAALERRYLGHPKELSSSELAALENGAAVSENNPAPEKSDVPRWPNGRFREIK